MSEKIEDRKQTEVKTCLEQIQRTLTVPYQLHIGSCDACILPYAPQTLLSTLKNVVQHFQYYPFASHTVTVVGMLQAPQYCLDFYVPDVVDVALAHASADEARAIHYRATQQAIQALGGCLHDQNTLGDRWGLRVCLPL